MSEIQNLNNVVNEAIATKVNQVLGTLLDGDFITVTNTAGFNYGIVWGNNGYYNGKTLKILDSVVKSEQENLQYSDQKLSKNYLEILANTEFEFSVETDEELKKMDLEAQSLIENVLEQFEASGFTYSDPLPYGGKIQDVINQLSDMFGEITSDCDNIPFTMSALRDALSAYILASENAYVLHSEASHRTNYLKKIISNIRTPKKENGGLQIGDSEYYVGYENLPTNTQLEDALSNEDCNIVIHIEGQNSTGDICKVTVDGKLGGDIEICHLITVSLGGDVEVNYTDYAYDDSSFSMDITYKGLKVVASHPLVADANGNKGWYDTSIIESIIRNTNDANKDGYKLTGKQYCVEDIVGESGMLNYLKTIVISQYPEIHAKFCNVNVAMMKKFLQVNSNAKVDLFGFLSLGSANGNLCIGNVDYNETANSASIDFVPPLIGTESLQNEVANILGGVEKSFQS